MEFLLSFFPLVWNLSGRKKSFFRVERLSLKLSESDFGRSNLAISQAAGARVYTPSQSEMDRLEAGLELSQKIPASPLGCQPSEAECAGRVSLY